MKSRTSALINQLNTSKSFFIAWSMIAAFGAYFCMYAFRKPFTAGTYAAHHFLGMDYKAILIVAQALGYMISKFIGIKIISELKPKNRQKLIIGLILFAEVSLLFFGLVPTPYNFIFIFFNGLPLGMVWGIVFNYLEGRRFTEVLAMGLSISLIISSGILKTVYFTIHGWLPAITDMWLPFFIGLFFLPFFLFFSWMLAVIPPPTETDKLLRVERVPMTAADKRGVLKEVGTGVLCFVLMYTFLATMRDFRDNFSVEIWNEIQPSWDKSVFSKTEMISGLVVLFSVGCLSLIRNNIKGFWATQWLIFFGILLSGGSTLLFQLHQLTPFWWMLLSGMGLFLAYIPIQVAVFERIIALFKLKANAGFFIYICDALGYMGSVALLLYREFFMKDMSWSKVLMHFSYLLTLICVVLLLLVALFFNRKMGVKSSVANSLKKLQTLN
jgi:MFS family permease